MDAPKGQENMKYLKDHQSIEEHQGCVPNQNQNSPENGDWYHSDEEKLHQKVLEVLNQCPEKENTRISAVLDTKPACQEAEQTQITQGNKEKDEDAKNLKLNAVK